MAKYFYVAEIQGMKLHTITGIVKIKKITHKKLVKLAKAIKKSTGAYEVGITSINKV